MSLLQKMFGKRQKRTHPYCAALIAAAGSSTEINSCRVEHFVDELDGDERTRTVLHGEKFRLERGLERRAQHGLCPRCAADDDLYGFSEAKGLAELSIRQQLVLPRSDDDLVDALHAVDREQCAHKPSSRR